MEHNEEFIERMAATVQALKAVWPVNPDGSRLEAAGEFRERRRPRTAAAFVRRSSDGDFERLLWQPWTHNRLL